MFQVMLVVLIVVNGFSLLNLLKEVPVIMVVILSLYINRDAWIDLMMISQHPGRVQSPIISQFVRTKLKWISSILQWLVVLLLFAFYQIDMV